ncbi:MAG: MBL fold metallo-hydrolase [Spirochaetota bacterium]
MRIFFHFSVIGFSNTYLVGNEHGDALLIDPGHMDLGLLELIESRGYYVRHILITHRHGAHVKGIGTLLKIYDAAIYAYSPYGYENFTINPIADGDELNLSGFNVRCLHVPGHSSDSVVFHIDNAVFTGDVILSGKVGTCESKLHRSLLMRTIEEKLLSLNANTLVFPGHGSPSTIRIEELFNEDLIDYKRHQK